MNDVIVWLCDSVGTRLMPLAHFDSLSFTRSVNDVGELTIVLPGHFDTSLARVDSLILVWRAGRLDTETAWLVRGVQRRTDRMGVQAVTLTAVSGADLLRRRIVQDVPLVASPPPPPPVVASPPVVGTPTVGIPTATRTLASDNLLKALVRENLGTLADAARQLPPALFSVAADTTSAPVVTSEAGNLNLLLVAQDIAKDSAARGTPLFFDVVYLPESNRWEFRTYTGARGTNKNSLSGAPQTLSVERGSVGSEQLDEDYQDEITFVYAGGRGTDVGRLSATAEDTTRSTRSVYGRREAFISSSTDDLTALTDEARTEVQRSRPRRSYVAEVISTSSSQYGRDWVLGDILTVAAYGTQFDCSVDAVQVTIDNLDGGKERVRVKLTNTAAL